MNRKTTSIARHLNLSWAFKKLFLYIFLDALFLALFFGGWCYWSETEFFGKFEYSAARNLEEDRFLQLHGEENLLRQFSLPEIMRHVSYTVSYPGSTETLEKDLRTVTESALLLIRILAIPEIISVLFTVLFGTIGIRRKLKPLDDMAKMADELGSRVGFGPDSYMDLENAIAHVSPDGAEQVVSTGNKDLEGVEMAINNLLARMQESYRQQSRFVSDASHELRTPIAVIQGYADMLDRWGKQDEQVLDESIQAIRHESDHMKTLVEQLLFLARGDMGRNQLKREDISLKSIIREVCEESRMIDENHVYELSEPSGDVRIIGDESMIKQSMRILVDNAAKYTASGESILLKSGVNEKGQSYFVIQDNGTGIDGEDVSHVFERFYRSDKARSSQTGGTGLGLSIAKWIVDHHNGFFEVLSRSGIGTRFTVTFKERGPVTTDLPK